MNLLREPFFLLLASVLLGWGVYSGGEPAKIRPADRPDFVFSAPRATMLLRELIPDNTPHVSGSAENAAVRDRLVAILKRFGYKPQVQGGFFCRPEIGRCSPADNVVAVLPGSQSGRALLLTAHYDSSWAGPGAADDGAGVAAVLEIARMAALEHSYKHDLIFLFTDAEEQGLIGAAAFAKENPLFQGVQGVINLEARGAGGPSIMFETGPGNRGLIRMLAKNLDRPVANSVAYEVYRHMPNDTDFSVYREYELPGVNFAFTGDASIYHSAIDDLNHLDPRSLQHHGQNAWAMLLAMDERSLLTRSEEDAAYIDLFGRKLLHYPVSSAIGLAIVLSVLVMVVIRRTYPRQVTIRQVLWTLTGMAVLTLALPVAGWVLSYPLGRWVDMSPLQHPFSWLGRLTLFAAAIWVLARTLRFLAPRASTGSVMLTCWALFALLAVVLGYVLPIAGYIAVLPLLGFSLGLPLDAFRWKKPPRLAFAALFGFFAAAYVGFYFFFQLDVVLNFRLSQFKMMPLLLPALAALPMMVWYFEGREVKNGFSHGLLVLIVAACIAQHFVPAYTMSSPRDMEVVYLQDDQLPEPLLMLESALGQVDMDFAERNGFVSKTLPAGAMQKEEAARQVMARAVDMLELPQIVETRRSVQAVDKQPKQQRHVVELEVPEGVRQLVFEFPTGAHLNRALWNGVLAFSPGKEMKAFSKGNSVGINHPKTGRNRLEFEVEGGAPLEVMVKARFDMPAELLQPLLGDWPLTAQPAFQGHRAVRVSHLKFEN
jgi:hypothetical protein